MVSDRHRTVICGYTRFDIEDLQYLVGTRKYNSTVNWKFPENRERNTAGGIVLIGDDMDSIFRSTVATDADFHRHLGVFGIASTAQLSRTVTGVQDPVSILVRTLAAFYTHDKNIPPPTPTTEMASTLASDLSDIIPDFSPFFNFQLVPAFDPHRMPQLPLCRVSGLPSERTAGDGHGKWYVRGCLSGAAWRTLA